MDFFTPYQIGDHATAPKGKLREIPSSMFSGIGLMDQVTQPGRRFANRFSNTAKQETEKRLEGKKKPTFWAIAPDGNTILRKYSGEEPLDLMET